MVGRRSQGDGLRGQVYPGGGKSFFVDYRIEGRQRRFTIGPFPRWSVTAAREEAKELRKQIDRGHDPAGQKRERREAPTVQDLIDRYVVNGTLNLTRASRYRHFEFDPSVF